MRGEGETMREGGEGRKGGIEKGNCGVEMWRGWKEDKEGEAQGEERKEMIGQEEEEES